MKRKDGHPWSKGLVSDIDYKIAKHSVNVIESCLIVTTVELILWQSMPFHATNH